MAPPPPFTEETEPPEQQSSWHRQPLTVFYLAFQIIYILGILLPVWIIKFTIPSNRPSPKWSLLLSVFIYLIRNLLYAFLNAGVAQSKRDTHKLLSGKRLRLVAGRHCREFWVGPVSDADIWGEVKKWKDKNGVEAKRVGAYMWGEGESDGTSVRHSKPNEKIVVHFHGGGYVMGSAEPTLMPNTAVAQTLFKRIEHSKSPSVHFMRLVSVEYHLCRAEPLVKERQNPFPTALLDGLAVVHHLVFTLGYHPRHIIISGDSAGGNIALALTRYLRDAPLPAAASSPDSKFDVEAAKLTSLLPGGVLLQSPWCDIASTHIPSRTGPNCSFERNSASDITGRNPYTQQRPFLGIHSYGLRGFSGISITSEDARTNPYFSPGSLDLLLSVPSYGTTDVRPTFEGYPPVFVSVGGREILYDEIRLTAERIQSHAHSKTIPIPAPTPNKDHSGNNALADHKGDSHGINIPYSWVTLDEEPEMFHDFCCMPLVKSIGNSACDRMVSWINALPLGEDCPP